ncbi:Receptor expression-enhancing protein [Echinococcus granulosus]|uniref:Receptor expression-enhancing protein n=1 Tax=Echinococcus granulosus TaxID=6210 RepID=W6UBZ7_ECHGR|nr:Receptor expression-enhancing protein [Echinococcus granulosus]EUB58660.1 Receptor expression-enhancing protein [Echinococcus granulosus]
MIVPLFCRFITYEYSLNKTFRTIFGVLYPAYKSYKALRYKDVKELVRLTMYWIVFSCFTAFETVGDILLAWYFIICLNMQRFPLYYEIKTAFVLYLVLPFTQGSSIIYRKIVHPRLSNKEKDIDQYIERAAESSCSALMHFGAKGLTYVANTAIHTAIKSQDLIINHLSQRSLSLDDIRPLALQKPGGDTSNTYQSYREGYNQASQQSNRSGRQRYSTTTPLDNVTELTEEESQNADSFNAIESGDISRGDHHRKSTSDSPHPPFQRPRRHVPVYVDCRIILHARADLSTASRQCREPVGRPEEARVVWSASLRQPHLHERPLSLSRLFAAVSLCMHGCVSFISIIPLYSFTARIFPILHYCSESVADAINSKIVTPLIEIGWAILHPFVHSNLGAYTILTSSKNFLKIFIHSVGGKLL